MLSLATELNMSAGTHQDMGAGLGQGWRTGTRRDKPCAGRTSSGLVTRTAPDGLAGKLPIEWLSPNGMVPRADKATSFL